MLTGLECKKCGCKKVYARLTKRILENGLINIAIRCNSCSSEYIEDIDLLGIENVFNY